MGSRKGEQYICTTDCFLIFPTWGNTIQTSIKVYFCFSSFFFLWIGDIAPTSINVYYQDQFLIMFQWMVGVEERKALIKVQKYATKEIGFRDMVRSYDVRMMSEFLRY